MWGPERETFTVEKPAAFVTFCAITNNPNYGDERSFVLARAVDESDEMWRTKPEVTENREYLMRIYVHNNAAESYGLVAENVRVVLSVPSEPQDSITVSGMIFADNAVPPCVWGGAIFHRKGGKIQIAYISKSAGYYTNINASIGFPLPDSIVTEKGALLGYDQLDGKIPGCYQYSGMLTAKIRVTLA